MRPISICCRESVKLLTAEGAAEECYLCSWCGEPCEVELVDSIDNSLYDNLAE